VNALRKELGTDEILLAINALTAKVDALTKPAGPEWLTVKQAAETMRVSTSTVRRRIADGSLPVKREGSTPMIHRDEVSPNL
jgi:excisionase family DNA binding protein